jgi:catechol 2,3-dioxygenase-like lactoylglutathione lyase family enzyme
MFASRSARINRLKEASRTKEGTMLAKAKVATRLPAQDLERARAFYKALGWTTGAEPGDDVVFFQAGCMIVALWDRAKLAEDSTVRDSGGWGGATLAYNVRSPQEVDAVLEEARAAGATIGREGDKTFWGGYSGVFVDPDGHPWEVAHNPRWTVHDDGSVTLPP